MKWAMAIALALLAACSKDRTEQSEAVKQTMLRAPASANDGLKIYATNCASCHQSDGAGIPGAFPALDGNPRVTGDPKRVVAIVKFGRNGMPRWAGLISDREIAAVVTYIRSDWHNHASPVSEADVQSVAR